MNVYPYRILGKSELVYLKERVESAAREWCEMRLQSDVTRADATIATNAYLHAQETEKATFWWCFTYPQDEDAIVLRITPELVARVTHLAAHTDESGSGEFGASTLTSGLCKKLLEGLAESIMSNMGVEPQSLVTEKVDEQEVRDIVQRGAGAVVVSIRIGGKDNIDLIVSSALTVSCLSRRVRPQAERQTLVPLVEALDREIVALEAWIGEADLKLTEIKDAAVGDVIGLGKSLSQPLEVAVSGHRAACIGFLGTSKGKKALELSAVRNN